MSLSLVKDLTHFNHLIQTRKSWNYSNCYLLPEAINDYIVKNALWFQEVSKGLLFFCVEHDFLYLYFYLENLEDLKFQFPIKELGKPIVMDLQYRGAQFPEKVIEVKNYWINFGLVHHEEYRHMTRKMTCQEKDCLVSPDFPQGFSWKKADESNFLEIGRLMRSELDIYNSPLPDYKDMVLMLDTGQLWCLLNSREKLVGSLRTIIKGKLCTIRQLVISKEFRNLGFADRIVKTVLASSTPCDHFDLWAAAGNQPAIKLYSRNGYEFDQKRITQLIYHEK